MANMKRGSLAKFVKEVWGIGINTKRFTSFSKYNDPYSNVVIVPGYSPPMENIFKNALLQLRISPKIPSQEDIDKIMKDPSAFLDYLYKFWEFSARILPPYNVVSSLIYTTRHIPKMLFEQLYGNIAKNDSLMRYLGYYEYKFSSLGNLANKYSFYFQRKDGLADVLFTIIKRNMESYNNSNTEFKNIMEHLPDLINTVMFGLKSYFNPLFSIKNNYIIGHNSYDIYIDLNTLKVKLEYIYICRP